MEKYTECRAMGFQNGYRRLFFRRSLPVPASGAGSKVYDLTPKKHCSGKPLRDALTGVWVAGNPAPPSVGRETRKKGGAGTGVLSLLRLPAFASRKTTCFETALRDARSDPSPFADCGSGLFLSKKSCLVRYGLRASALAFAPYRFAFRPV